MPEGTEWDEFEWVLKMGETSAAIVSKWIPWVLGLSFVTTLIERFTKFRVRSFFPRQKFWAILIGVVYGLTTAVIVAVLIRKGEAFLSMEFFMPIYMLGTIAVQTVLFTTICWVVISVLDYLITGLTNGPADSEAD